MKYMKQFGIILSVTCLGEILKFLLPFPFPGSIYGLLLMFVLLLTHVIPVEDVKETGEFLVEIMPVMFIPAGVGLMTAWDSLRPMILPVLVITVLTTFFVMIATGRTAQKMIDRRRKRTGEGSMADAAEETAEKEEKR